MRMFQRFKPKKSSAKSLRIMDVDGAEKKIIEDYLMIQVFNTLESLKKPIQIHTGNQQQWNIVSNGDPLALNKILYTGKWHNAKFLFCMEDIRTPAKRSCSPVNLKMYISIWRGCPCFRRQRPVNLCQKPSTCWTAGS